MNAGSPIDQNPAPDAASASGEQWPPPGWVEPRQVMVEAGTVALGALFYGDPDNHDQGAAGGTVILLHGWADSAWSMDSVAQALIGRHRVIGLDLRGHGRSDRGSYDMVHLIGDLRGAIEALEVADPILIGHSLGGQISAQFCGLFPDLPRALVVVEGVGPPPHRLASADPDELERVQTRKQVERVRQPTRVRRLADRQEAAARLRQAHPLLDPARAAFLAERNTVANDDGTFEWRHDPRSRDWLNGHSPEVAAQRWRGITCPVLIINGTEAHERYWRYISDDPADYPAPLVGEALSERLSHFRDADYVEIPDAGHMLPYDRPNELNAVIERFLARFDTAEGR